VNEIGPYRFIRGYGDGVPLYAQPYPGDELEMVRSKQYPSGLLQVFYRVK